MPQAVANLEPENSEVVQLGKFRLLALIARGGMGDIYLSMSEGPAGFRKLVVVKVLRTDAEEEETYRSMFLDEGMLAARLNHPNVVQTLEVGETGGQLYIAMEYLEGQSLSRLMRAAGKIPGPLAARIIADALTGLEYAHDLCDFDGSPLHIVHRDLSPQNVFVTYDGVVKLVDFGIAKAALTSRAMTEIGVLKGKISYMAPEHANGGVVDRRSDVFAMGIVLWELVSGRRLFDPRYASQSLRALLDPEPFARLTTICAEADRYLEGIVARALEKQPEYRYQSAAEMRADLEAYIAQVDPSIRVEHTGQFVLGHFSAHRETMQQQIRACVAAAPAGGDGQLPVIGLRVRSNTDASGLTGPRSGSQRTNRDVPHFVRAPIESESRISSTRWPAELRVPPLLRSKRTAVVVGVALVLALSILGWLSLFPDNAKVPAATSHAPVPVAPRTRAPSTPVQPQPPPSNPAEVAGHPARPVAVEGIPPEMNDRALRRGRAADRPATVRFVPTPRPAPAAVVSPAPAEQRDAPARSTAPKRHVDLVDDSDGVQLVE